MSEGIVIALIGFAGAVLGAAIAGFAAITAAGVRKGESQVPCGVLGLLASLGAAGGLVLGAFLGATLVQQTPRATYQPIAPQPTQAVIVVTATFQPQSRAIPTAIIAPTQPPRVLNCTAVAHSPLEQGNYAFTGAVHIVELWRANKQTPWGDKLVTAVVIGDVSIVNAGGSVWTYPAGCEDTATREVYEGASRTGAQVVTESELRAAGIIK